MVPDPFKKTARIPLRLVGGEFKISYGGDLPAMREGTIGELIVSEYSVTDKYKLSLMPKEGFDTPLVVLNDLLEKSFA